MSRRGLLAGAATVVAGSALAPARASAAGTGAAAPPPTIHTAVRPDRFGRLFDLPPFANPTTQVKTALRTLGAPGGIMDAKDDLAAGPLGLILNPGANTDNPNHTAGMTFVGQFIDHDITLDATSPLGVPTAPEATINRRTPAFDLDSVYGSGPFGDPLLYEDDKLRLKAGRRGEHEDVPRLPDGTALIGDSRNDENVAVNGIHAAFIAAHNQLLTSGAATTFKDARRQLTWHWQWIVLNEFLPATLGTQLPTALSRGDQRLFPRGCHPFIPVEFQSAAYRFGHSQVRPSYRMNFTGGPDGGQRFAFVFDPSQITAADPSDMQGGIAGAGRHIGWPTFFNFGGDRAQWVRPNKTIDTKLSTPLFHLPPKTVRGPEDVLALAQRNLLRHLTWSLPSGQAIAKKLGLPVLSTDQLADVGRVYAPFAKSTPLWFYVLREAELLGAGKRLGPLGGLLVGGTLIGLLLADPSGYLNAAPGWKPTLGSTPGKFGMSDLLDYAGVGGVR
ncbi:hypothetical protein OJ998_34025 [Solirubrobacter taibaiensis]|nr:hypothetical protein [Solirubrobacter taibaiensis]